MKEGTRVKVNCPVYKKGKSFVGVITGEKTIPKLYINQNGKTFYVKIDGNKKSSSFHESWLTEIK